MSYLSILGIDGPVATLTMNRPEQRNAMSIAMLESMHERVDELESKLKKDDAPRVLVLTGEGKAFCAGMDLSEVLIDESGDRELPLRLLSTLGELTLRLRSLPIVTIAKINGAAVGGGCGLSTVCDIGVTHAECVLGFPEVDLGLCPAVVAPWVVRKIGPGTARRVLLQGGVMKGTDAHACGLVDHLAGSADELDELTRAVADRIATGGPEALGATKNLLNEIDGSHDADTVRRGAELSASVLLTPDAQARLRARKR